MGGEKQMKRVMKQFGKYIINVQTIRCGMSILVEIEIGSRKNMSGTNSGTKVLEYDIINKEDGSIVFEIMTSGMKQRMTFTEV